MRRGGAAGRHVDPADRSFYASLGVAGLRGLVAVAVSFGVYAGLASLRGGDAEPAAAPPDPHELAVAPSRTEPPRPPQATASARTAEEPLEAPSTRPAPSLQPTPVVTPTAAPEAVPAPSPTPTPATGAPAPSATTVQVLDGGAGSARTRAAVRLLEGIGYQVVAVNDARATDVTTVYYTAGNRSAGEALLARDGRFRRLQANRNLSERVDLHVVVGPDWAA